MLSSQFVGSSAKIVSFAIVSTILLTSSATFAFLFPDLKGIRTGRNISYYKIAVIQEEPFLFEDGSGYVPDLLRLINNTYHTTSEDAYFPYKIAPVSSWHDLMVKASSTHWKVAFGATSPSVLRTNEHWKGIHTSHSTTSSTMKMIARNDHGKNFSIPSQNKPPPPLHNSGSTVNTFHESKIYALIGSTEESLLLKNPKFQENLESVGSLQEGLQRLRDEDNGAVLVTDAAVADHAVGQVRHHKLVSRCPTKKPHPNILHYAFFGRDTLIIKFINDMLKQIPDQVDALNRKYFAKVKQCSYKR